MGVITISLDHETEKKLRKLAREKYGDKKGAMSMVIKNSLELVENKEEAIKKTSSERLLHYMENGIARGKEKFSLKQFREEIYNERINRYFFHSPYCVYHKLIYLKLLNDFPLVNIQSHHTTDNSS
ncbi:hypothetical protein HZA96_05515 [Candidatus Woesearchaeota archaeon]|nr:hypothetical protein [Candidatus Woesearchaeota archaeon]